MNERRQQPCELRIGWRQTRALRWAARPSFSTVSALVLQGAEPFLPSVGHTPEYILLSKQRQCIGGDKQFLTLLGLGWALWPGAHDCPSVFTLIAVPARAQFYTCSRTDRVITWGQKRLKDEACGDLDVKCPPSLPDSGVGILESAWIIRALYLSADESVDELMALRRWAGCRGLTGGCHLHGASLSVVPPFLICFLDAVGLNSGPLPRASIVLSLPQPPSHELNPLETEADKPLLSVVAVRCDAPAMGE